MAITIAVSKTVTTTDTGHIRLVVTTTGAGVTSKVFAIEVYPASADPQNAEYRFSHVCSPMELNELPEDTPGESSYFRVNEIAMIFDTAAMASATYNTIESNVRNLVRELNQLDALARNISSTTYDIACILAAPMEFEFSVDNTSWHKTQTTADLWYRQRNSAMQSDWSTGIKMIASTGTGDMLKSIYDTNNDGVVNATDKLGVARKIGNADFDGSADITVAQIGAETYGAVSSHNVSAAAHSELFAAKANTDDLSDVATSGDYADLSNKPDIPTVTNSITQGSTDAVTSGAVYDGVAKLLEKNQPITAIPSATTAHTFAYEGVYSHLPSASTTYTLPDVTDATVTHDICLYVDMATTASIAFVTSGGTSITPKMATTPAVGEKWCFYCTYEFGAWNIYGLRIEEAQA